MELLKAPISRTRRSSLCTLYLWHQPLFRRIALEDFALSGPQTVTLKFSLAFALAMASYVLVERPALRLKRRFQALPRPAVTAPDQVAAGAKPTSEV